MKFEEQIEKTLETLTQINELTNPVPTGQAPVGQPTPSGQTAPAGQPATAGQSPAGEQPAQQPQITSGQLLSWALKADPNKMKEFGIDPESSNEEELFQNTHNAYMAQLNPAAASNPQTSSAAPASVSPAGVPGATTVGV